MESVQGLKWPPFLFFSSFNCISLSHDPFPECWHPCSFWLVEKNIVTLFLCDIPSDYLHMLKFPNWPQLRICKSMYLSDLIWVATCWPQIGSHRKFRLKWELCLATGMLDCTLFAPGVGYGQFRLCNESLYWSLQCLYPQTCWTVFYFPQEGGYR